jgi:phosphatidylserine/phosphatidylglycerophosphate/cardiolipin synthase-like enzyme
MRRLIFIAFSLFLTLAITFLAHATVGEPPIYFTDNLARTAVTTTVQPWEQPLLDLLNGATTTIDATLYEFDRSAIRAALLAAHARGVQVRIVTDNKARIDPGYVDFYNDLASAGIPVINDSQDDSVMHNKYFIIDGQQVWTGSMNLSDADITLNQNDSLDFTSTALAQVYAFDFNQMVNGSFATAKTATPTTTLTYAGSPLEIYFSPQDNAMAHILAAVDAAQQTIDFAILIFTDPTLRDALLAASDRGVLVRGLFDAEDAADSTIDDELAAAGILLKREDAVGDMHHKFLVIDAALPTARVIMGSLNWTADDNTLNNENTVILHSPVVAAQYASHFQAMWDPPPAATLYFPLICRTGASDLSIKMAQF